MSSCRISEYASPPFPSKRILVPNFFDRPVPISSSTTSDCRSLTALKETLDRVHAYKNEQHLIKSSLCYLRIGLVTTPELR